jgi:hypothetical protein
VARLDFYAKKKEISREQYLRNELETIAMSAEMRATEDRYENLIKKLLEIVEHNNEVLEKNNYLMEEFMEGIDSYDPENV